MRRLLKGLWAAALCLNPVTSLWVVGWTQALQRRRVLRAWATASRGETSPDDFIGAQDAELSAWRTFTAGALAYFNTAVMTLPGAVLWMFAWYDGWNNSFHKGYEQAWVAPVVGLLGSVLFIAAMLYVPLAQARQAAAADWRAFYAFRVVWSVTRAKWLSCLGLAASYAALALPVTLLRMAPNFFGNAIPAGAGEAAAGDFLLKYSYGACLYVLAAGTALRLAAARVYAAGVLELVKDGVVAEADLAPAERAALGRLGLLRAEAPEPRHPVLRVLGWAGTRTGRAVSLSGAVALWAAFVFQVFATQFINFTPRSTWLNQPLVQLPWFRLKPSGR